MLIQRTIFKLILCLGLYLPAGIHVVSAREVNNTNYFQNPDFENFVGNIPVGWYYYQGNFDKTANWISIGIGKTKKDKCLELNLADTLVGSTNVLWGPKIVLKPNHKYVFKGYYLSTCKKVSFVLTWLDNSSNPVGSFDFILPETQGHWESFFDEFISPENTAFLRVEIRQRWAGKLCFDDFSLRHGTLIDYENEFSLKVPTAVKSIFPIIGCPPPTVGLKTFYGRQKDQFNRNRFYAEYAMANFTIGDYAKFGVRTANGTIKVPKDPLLVKKMGKDPMVWAFVGRDEPREKLFPQQAKLSSTVKKLAPQKLFFNNLLPTYAFRSLKEYESYIGKYIKIVKPSFLMYDHYAFRGQKGIRDDCFANLEIVRKLSNKADINFGVYLLVTPHGPYRNPNEAELRWQAYTALAYGAKSLGWFTYLTPQNADSNYHNAVIDIDGNRTNHYSMLRQLNSQILALGGVLLNLQSTGVFHSAPLPKLAKGISTSKFIKGVSKGAWLLGEFSDKKNNNFLMIVNRDYKKDRTINLKLRKAVALKELDKKNGTWMTLKNSLSGKNKNVILKLKAGEGRLLFLK